MTDANWGDTIDVNFTESLYAIRANGSHLVKRGGGRIIVTASTQGRHGTKFRVTYSASKWGIVGLVKSAALELGAHKITRPAYRHTKAAVMLLVLVDAETVVVGVSDPLNVQHSPGTVGFGTAGERRRWMLRRGGFTQRSPTPFVGLLRV